MTWLLCIIAALIVWGCFEACETFERWQNADFDEDTNDRP